MPEVQGQIVSLAASGNAITDITTEQLRAVPHSDHTTIRCNEHETRGIFPPNHQEPPFTFLALLGEAGVMELCIVGDSARDMLGLRPGMTVEVKW